MTVSLRPFDLSQDYRQVHDLWSCAGKGVRVGRSDTPEALATKLGRDPDLFLVAESGGEIVGTVIAGFDGRRGMIYHLAVRADHRRQGIAARLLQAAEKGLADRGCLKAYLLVTTDNHEAMDYYRRRGWSQMDHVVLFGKDLA
jgi:ribosomal protein S18 acetylase RimI-like enzyme